MWNKPLASFFLRKFKLLVLQIVLFLGINTNIHAHESRPLAVKISVEGRQVSLETNLPNTVNAKNLPIVYLNDRALNDQQQWIGSTAGFRQKWTVIDTNFILKGARISIKYPIFNPVISTIIVLTFADGSEQILLIPPNEQAVVIPREVNALEVRKQYSLLGIEHIWAGIDHLLFLACLFLITGFGRKLFYTITGFTIAHSITLILSALKIIQLPIPPIEATIALSIVFLCYEIIHHHQDKKSLTYRYPMLVASLFGLLHGLGFAAVLREIGLPNKHTMEALLFFNIGVEIGQIIFILALFLAFGIFNKLMNRFLPIAFKNVFLSKGLQVIVYTIGTVAAYWMFDRIL